MAIENVLNDAMNLKPSERALLAQRLIRSLSENDDDVEQQWLELAKKRLRELKGTSVSPMNWEDIRIAVKKG